MSLYYEAASFLIPHSEGSLKSRVLSHKELKSHPKQIYALASETARWSPILADLIERSQLLQIERKVYNTA